MSAGRMGLGARTRGPPVPADNSGLPGVPQRERVNLPASPRLVFEQLEQSRILGGVGKPFLQARVGEDGGERLRQIGPTEGEAVCI